MALISCPECSREVSSQAAACPHCGYPLQSQPAAAKSPLPDAEQRLREVLLTGDKIAAIKLYREMHPGLGLAEAKHHVDRLVQTLPVAAQQRLGGVGCLFWLVAGGTLALYWSHGLF